MRKVKPIQTTLETRLREFIEREREVNRQLESNGAGPQAQARGRILANLEDVLAVGDDAQFSVADAHALSGACTETVRRAVRNGEIPDRRTNSRGPMRLTEGDVAYLKGKSRTKRKRDTVGGYDPAKHARKLIGLP